MSDNPSMIDIIAQKIHKDAVRNSGYTIDEAADTGTMPSLPADSDNADKQNAEKKNAPGEKAPIKGPIQMNPDNDKAYKAMGVKLGEESDIEDNEELEEKKLTSKEKMKRGLYNSENNEEKEYTVKVSGGIMRPGSVDTAKVMAKSPKHAIDTVKKTHLNRHKGTFEIHKEATDVDSDNVEKALKHDCASHVVHKEHGEGRCIPGMHTLEENEDGTGFVTHYDVMFEDDNGPFIVEDCPVEDLEIVQEMNHGHSRKKKK